LKAIQTVQLQAERLAKTSEKYGAMTKGGWYTSAMAAYVNHGDPAC
jgi:hypothetical protein